MALQVSSDAQLVFFNKVFGLYSPVTERVKALQGLGITFEVSLYSIRAYGPDGVPLGPVKLTIGSTSLIKGTVDQSVTLQNMHLIEGWIAEMYQAHGAPVSKAKAVDHKVVLVGSTHPLPHLLKLVKAVFTVTGWTLVEAKKKVQEAMAGIPAIIGVYPSLEAANAAAAPIQAAEGKVEITPVGTHIAAAHSILKKTGPLPTGGKLEVSFAPKPVDKVIDLKAAEALGQKVHGTSSGSVYHTIALSEHGVKIAARLYKSGSISIRAEWTPASTLAGVQAELKKLEESGVQMKANYGSIHFDAQDVPLQRVIGAFLVGTGIQWKAAVMNGAELVIGEK